MTATTPGTTFESNPPEARTWSQQDSLTKLPIPPLEDTCKRYLKALEGLQDPKDHARTKAAVDSFLQGEGPKIHDKLLKWAETKDRYVIAFVRLRRLMPAIAT